MVTRGQMEGCMAEDDKAIAAKKEAEANAAKKKAEAEAAAKKK